jgi:hypothetical protein
LKVAGAIPSHTDFFETFTNEFGFQAVRISDGTPVELTVFFVVELGDVAFAI